jgi:hypothetical protein
MAFFISFPGMVLAQSPELETTCQTVAKNFLLTDKVAIGSVQSFPELKPPGVRMTYSTRQGIAPADITDVFECEFDRAEKPHHLSRFCVANTCYSASEDDGDRKRRFSEMRILLDRAEK